jgi:ribosome-associated translation inhibitor RaiA
MRLFIAGRGVEITPEVREHVVRRLRLALAPFSERIIRVAVKLEHCPGAEDGTTKLCKLLVRLAGIPSVVVGLEGTDLITTIDRAVDRAGYLVDRRLKRSLATHREQPPLLRKAWN